MTVAAWKESLLGLEVRHKWPEGNEKRKRRFSTWVGAESIAVDLNYGEKSAFLMRIIEDRQPSDSYQLSLRVKAGKK